MNRFWIEKELIYENIININDELHHHIKDVLKLAEGEIVEFYCGDQKKYLSKITKLNKKNSQATILEILELAIIPDPKLILCVGLSHIDTLKFITEKSVELGVSEIKLFTSHKTTSISKKNIHLEKFNKIIKQATRQCSRGDLMKISSPQFIESLIIEMKAKKSKGLFCYEKSDPTLRTNIKTEFINEKEVWIFIGSEGGFTEEENELFIKNNFSPFHFGSLILKVETATIAAISILNHELSRF